MKISRFWVVKGHNNVLLLFGLKYQVYFNLVPVEVYFEHECKVQASQNTSKGFFSFVLCPVKLCPMWSLWLEQNTKNICRGPHEVSAMPLLPVRNSYSYFNAFRSSFGWGFANFFHTARAIRN